VNDQYGLKANKNHPQLKFKLGDLVWLYLRKERFRSTMKNKLPTRRYDPYKVVQKVDENAYKLELLDDMNIVTTFNIRDLTPYFEDEDEYNEGIMANPIQLGEVYAEHTT